MEQKITNRQIKAVETREKIVRAAKELIAEKGFEETSIGDIVRRAGVSTGSFYTYFKKKEDVVEALSQTDFYRLAEIVNAMEDVPLLTRLTFYCREFLKDIETTGIEICRQWLKNNLSPVEMFIAGERITKLSFDTRVLHQILAEGIRRGELQPDAPIDELVLLINGELYGLMVIWCMTDGKIKGSEQTEVFNRMLATVLFAEEKNKF